ncbi:MAG TPA: hypothetical protein PLE78_11975 [Flavobacteriales bacterium]|nr:hypothetical protein [Flavobacteriales bacterium]
MEPIPYFYGSIDRNAILVRPKQPFFDRANSLFQDGTKLTSYDECNIYLIREMHSNEAVQHWVRENFDDLFVNELNDWCTDEDQWPADRDHALFATWFSVEVHSMVLDLEEGPVTKE